MSKVAIVTGASSGIGKKFLLSLKEHGSFDEVVAISRSEAQLNKLKEETDLPITVMPLDLSDVSFKDKVIEYLSENNREVTMLINAAGFGKFEKTENVSLQDNLNMIDLNCRALTEMCYICLPFMKQGSKIINIASVAAFQPIPYINVYAASKAYVLSFTRAFAREVKSKGIRVMALCPFWTKTAFFNRAIEDEKTAVVKKYIVMYEPDFIVKQAWKALEKTNKDYYIPGFVAQGQTLLTKLLPHKIVMDVWMNQQDLK